MNLNHLIYKKCDIRRTVLAAKDKQYYLVGITNHMITNRIRGFCVGSKLIHN